MIFNLSILKFMVFKFQCFIFLFCVFEIKTDISSAAKSAIIITEKIKRPIKRKLLGNERKLLVMRDSCFLETYIASSENIH